MSGNDNKGNFRECIKEDLAEFENGDAAKDWIYTNIE